MVMTDAAPVKDFAIRVAQVGSWVALYGDGSGRSDLKRFVAEVERGAPRLCGRASGGDVFRSGGRKPVKRS